ncbi:MAG: hypothetical protein RJA99_4934 [Pseudomonadota bacterium]|jgi:uncharacterized membrane protein YjdF
MRPKAIDLFGGVNLTLFLILCVFRYHARFIQYRGAAHLEEFFIYAGAIIAGVMLLWWVFRHYRFDALILACLQVGIFMHFCGAFVLIDGGRLYDAHLLGIRWDKYVHFVNAFAATALVARLFEIQRIALTRVNLVFVLLVVLGLGAVVEIVEYGVVLTVPRNGVGDYDNTMQDLLSNLCGSLAHLAVFSAFRRASAAYRAGRPVPVPVVAAPPAGIGRQPGTGA